MWRVIILTSIFALVLLMYKISTSDDDGGEKKSEKSPGIETKTREDASTIGASPAAARRVSWLGGDETLEDAALRKRRQWVEGMTIKK